MQIDKQRKFDRSIKVFKRTFIKPTPFFLAAAITGLAWYFNKIRVQDFNKHQDEIIKRVQQDVTGENFKKEFQSYSYKSWEGKKVNLDGYVKTGRFFIKRNRGNQQGYLVLAPFTVNAHFHDPYDRDVENMQMRSSQRKFVLNLGWLPKSSKHLAPTMTEYSIIGEEKFEDYDQAIKKQEQDGLFRDPTKADLIIPIANVTAYIRKGEHKDSVHGLTNFKKERLYKFIDLPFLTRVFRIFNEKEAETIYLERTAKSEQENETMPLPASKEVVIEDLRRKAKENEQNGSLDVQFIGGLSFVAATLITFM